MLNQQLWKLLLTMLVLVVALAAVWNHPSLVASANEDKVISSIAETAAVQSEPDTQEVDVTVGRSLRAAGVLGLRVHNLEGDSIGQIEDIVVNMVNGNILFVTMNYDGGLFQSDKVYPVPAGAFSWNARREELQLDLAEETLQDAPGFDSDWPDPTDPDFDREVYDYWLKVFPELPVPAETGPVELAHVAKVSNMLGLGVVSPLDESLGEIGDIIFNVELQQLSAVVVIFESYTGIGDEQYVLPLSNFTFDISDESDAPVTPQLDMSQNNLRFGPTFSEFVDLNDPNWSEPYQDWWERMQNNAEQPVTPLTLAGTSWQLESFGEIEDNLPVITGTYPTVNFLGERYGGYGGCDWFLGVYDAEVDHGLRLQTPAQSRLTCEPAGISEQQATYITSLLNILEYELKDDRLIGYAIHNQRLVTFTPVEPAPFDTTIWSLKYFRYETHWHAGIYGTEITAQFEDDQLSGSAGCNTYQATVNKIGDKLTISNLTVTEMACTEPEGVMAQEEDYLTLLQTVGSMTQVGGILELADDTGQPILLFGVKISE